MTSQKILRPGSAEALELKAKSGGKLMMGNYEFLYEPLTDDGEEYLARIKKEIRETPENMATGLKTLRELLREESNLNVPDTDDFLVKFLRPCKWYPDSSFELMKRFYKFHKNYPQYHEELYPSNEKKTFANGILAPTPLRTKGGERVLIMQAGSRWNPKKVSLTEMFRAVQLTLEAAISEPKTQICGVHVILDMEGLSLSHVTYFTPGFARAVLEWIQRCLPCRMKGIHIVNQPYIFNMVFAIFKPFIHEKLRKRIHFHGTNRETLFAHVDCKVLPKMYGGALNYETDAASESFWKYLMIFNDDFIENNKYGYTNNKN